MIKLQKTGNIRHIYLPDGREISRITDALSTGKIISFVGGGGKTSSMYRLGLEYAEKGCSVIMTTSTRIRPFANEFPENLSCTGFPEVTGKLKGPEDPDQLIHRCDYLLIEADGSRGLPMKMPADHEPVISSGTDTVLAVFGLQAIGQPLARVCHRWQIATGYLGKSPEDPVTAEDAARIILSPQGLRKSVGSRSYGVILNQADRPEDLANGMKIAALLSASIPCVITSYEESEFTDIER